MTENEMKTWVDNASYQDLLQKNRFSKIGDPFFQGEMGDYTLNAMQYKKEALPDGGIVPISKRIGWKR